MQENFQFQNLTPYSMQQPSRKSNIRSTSNTLHNVTSLSQQSLTSQRNNITITHDYPNNNKIHVLRTLSN